MSKSETLLEDAININKRVSYQGTRGHDACIGHRAWAIIGYHNRSERYVAILLRTGMCVLPFVAATARERNDTVQR